MSRGQVLRRQNGGKGEPVVSCIVVRLFFCKLVVRGGVSQQTSVVPEAER